MAGFSVLQATPKVTLSWTAQNNLTGTDYQPLTNQGSISKQITYTQAVSNSALTGADLMASYIVTVSAGSATTIDLTAITDMLQRSSQTFARVKAMLVRLLNVADDSTNGTACTSVTVGHSGQAVTNLFPFNTTAGSGLTVAVTVTGDAITGVSIGAAGSGYPKSSYFLVAAIQSTASQGIIAVTTNSSGVPTAVAVVAGGSGYSAATLATTPLSFSTVFAGGCDMYFDATAAGFTVSSTAKNVRIANNDGAVAAAVQITVIGGFS
jgi:hypothetical protein